MSFDTVEQSAYGGAPAEFFHFVMGSTHWRLTSCDAERTVLDPTLNLYTSAEISRTEAQFSGEDSSGDIGVTLPRDHAIAQLFRIYTPPKPISLVVYALHRSDTADELRIVFTGDVASCDFLDVEGKARLNCYSASGKLRRMVPGIAFTPRCNLVWGSPRCGVNIETYREAADLTAVDGVNLEADVFGTHPDGYWQNGWVERSNGEARTITSHVGTAVVIAAPFIGLEAGETVSVLPGCQHTEAACTAFNNLVNALVWPRIPTRNPVTVGVY